VNCERCNQRPANVHLTQVINNKKTEMYVCDKCATEMQQQTWGFNPDHNLQNFLSGLMGYGFNSNVAQENSISCPQCGMTDKAFAKGGLLGCAHCYQIFGEQLLPLVKRIHGTVQHTGKVPERTGGKAKIAKEIRILKVKLHHAIGSEEFEKAAKLRDQIRSLEQQLQ